eukprot:TRINITY_DN23091_c0_g1_i1.p1 TRINITY_DN23091_c0_g1~~TRINITY_DN23091_c0_g1_i1.p1  ORF type:complete len:213 (+),score=56.99 TRINITY_DN23091_c0_g1_i1:162-800(+)
MAHGEKRKSRSRTQSPRGSRAGRSESKGDGSSLPEVPAGMGYGAGSEMSLDSDKERSSSMSLASASASRTDNEEERDNEKRGGGRAKSTPPANRATNGRPLWGVKLEPLKEAPHLPEKPANQDPIAQPLNEGKRDSLRYNTRTNLMSLEQPPTLGTEPHPLTKPLPSGPPGHNALRPLEQGIGAGVASEADPLNSALPPSTKKLPRLEDAPK